MPGSRIYLGSFLSEDGHGLTEASTDLTTTTAITGVPNASWLALSDDRRTLYATNETDQGTVTAIRRADHRVLARQPTLGAAPTHLTVHPNGRFLLTANYGSGSVAVHPLARDGAIEPATDVTDRPSTVDSHAHQVVTDPSGDWVIVVDIGADTLDVHRLDPATGTLTHHDRTTLPAGTGPRHLAFHPGGGHGYLLAEHRSELHPFRWSAAAGRLSLGSPVDTVPPSRRGPNYPGEILVSDDGRFCYASNRGDNSIATFAIGGDLRPRLLNTVPTGGDWPRHFALTQRRILIANQRSGTVTALARDPDTGSLSSARVVAAVRGIAMVLVADLPER